MTGQTSLSPAEVNFILHWADDKYIMGHEIASQTRFYGPDLEENLALGSLAQDDLGHARLLYGLLAESDLEIDKLVYLRSPGEYRNSLLAATQEPDNWAFWVIKGLLFAQAELVRCQAINALFSREPAQNSDKAQWLYISNIIIQDDAIHLEHWQQWLEVLGRQPEGHARLQAALERLLPLGREFFHARTWNDLAGELKIPAPESGLLLEEWNNRLAALLKPLFFNVSSLYAVNGNNWAAQYCGREGRHTPELVRMLEEDHALYQSYPEAALGSV